MRRLWKGLWRIAQPIKTEIWYFKAKTECFRVIFGEALLKLDQGNKIVKVMNLSKQIAWLWHTVFVSPHCTYVWIINSDFNVSSCSLFQKFPTVTISCWGFSVWCNYYRSSTGTLSTFSSNSLDSLLKTRKTERAMTVKKKFDPKILGSNLTLKNRHVKLYENNRK